MQSPTLTFRLSSASNVRSRDIFRPRLGSLSLSRNNASVVLETPAMLTVAPQGVVPHLSRDHIHLTPAIKWIHLPLETFLEHTNPLLSQRRIADLCGFSQHRHIFSLSLRSPSDTRHVPNNGDKYVHVLTSRGARKVAPIAYKTLVQESHPDIVFLQGDICIGNAPHSQKRLTKEIERGCAWLLEFLSPPNRVSNIFLSLVGGESPEARSAFGRVLLEPPDERERTLLGDLKCLDDSVFGYTIDLAPIHLSLAAVSNDNENHLGHLVKASLQELSSEKPRAATATSSPFEVLQLVGLGIDIFDVQWALDAAQWGVVLDFSFPTNSNGSLGHNLYDPSYSSQFTPLGSNECTCGACSPVSVSKVLDHNPRLTAFLGDRGVCATDANIDAPRSSPTTRAYIHHLLQTHEIAAHAILTMHNLSVADAFFTGIREQLAKDIGAYELEVAHFLEAHDKATWSILEEGKNCWVKVDQERGKGRLKREKEENEATDELLATG